MGRYGRRAVQRLLKFRPDLLATRCAPQQHCTFPHRNHLQSIKKKCTLVVTLISLAHARQTTSWILQWVSLCDTPSLDKRAPTLNNRSRL